MMGYIQTWLSEKMNRFARALVAREHLSLREYQHWFDTNPGVTPDGHHERFELLQRLNRAGSTNDIIVARRWIEHSETHKQLVEPLEMVLKVCIPYAPPGPHRHHFINQIVSAFQDEIRINNLIASTNIEGVIRSYGGGQAGRILFLRLERIKGRSLDHQFRIDIDTAEFARRLAQLAYLANTISQLHHYHVAHMDIKPQNLMLCEDADHPNYGKILMLDFGYSNARLRDTVSREGGQLSPLYSAPEQALLTQAHLTRAVDYFSFGVVAHEYLTGYHLFPQALDIFTQDDYRITRRYLDHLHNGRANRIAHPEVRRLIDLITTFDSQTRLAVSPNVFELAYAFRNIAVELGYVDVNTDFLKNQLQEYQSKAALTGA